MAGGPQGRAFVSSTAGSVMAGLVPAIHAVTSQCNDERITVLLADENFDILIPR
jgi:hypothetical protein